MGVPGSSSSSGGRCFQHPENGVPCVACILAGPTPARTPHPWGPSGIPNPLREVVASLQAEVDGLARQNERLGQDNDLMREALVEIDTYLANDPDVWRIVSVCKAGEILCDVLGDEAIAEINASVPENLCADCLGKIHSLPGAPEAK